MADEQADHAEGSGPADATGGSDTPDLTDAAADTASAAEPGSTDRVLAELAERETAYGLLQRGRQMMRRRHNAQAAVLLERARRLEPGKGSIVETLARAYYNSGQHQRAAEAFRELLEIDPSSAYAHFGLGQALKQVGQADVARTHLRLAVALAPHSALYRRALDRLG